MDWAASTDLFRLLGAEQLAEVVMARICKREQVWLERPEVTSGTCAQAIHRR